MPDQTPVTDDDRLAHEWAADSSPSWGPLARAAARVILATVPAPPKSLSEQMLDIAGGISSDFGAYADDLNTLADRVKAVEVENVSLRIERDQADYLMQKADRERDEARADVERLAATFKEHLKEPGHLPDQQVIRTPAELEALDGETIVGSKGGYITSATELRLFVRPHNADRHLPAVVLRDGAGVRTCWEALEGETK